jgi:hypothetical protein
MGKTTFSGPVNSTAGFVGALTGNVTGDVIGAVKLPTFTVATAPSAVTAGAGTLIFVSNGAEGSPILAFSDGTDWKRSDTGATIAAE